MKTHPRLTGPLAYHSVQGERIPIMKALKPRSHTICVRMSAEEHEALTRIRFATNARSLSDLIRNACTALFNGETHNGVLGVTITEISNRTKSIEPLAKFPTVAFS